MAKKADCWYKKVCTNECTNSCIRYIEMKYLMESAGIPTAQQMPKTLKPMCDEDDKAFSRLSLIKDNIIKFVWKGKNLYINSENPGTAKTSWSLKLLMKYFDCIWSGNGLNVRGMFVHVPTLLQKLKDFENPLSDEYIENIKNCDLVVWDDIAFGSKISNYDYNQLLILIDTRVLNNKSNIYTSNITSKDQLTEVVGARLASRIYDTSEIITFYGRDGRGEFAK